MEMTTSGAGALRDYIVVNGKSYRKPQRTTVVICFDGCDPAYIESASQAGVTPTLDAMRSGGHFALADAAMPTFTNPNNVSIVCGAPPSVHGVAGNFYLDRATGETVMMLDAALMRAPTILAGLAELGSAVAVVTAKDKLRKALAFGLDGIAFSAECAEGTTEDEHGIADAAGFVGLARPDQYSAELSLFVLDAGIRLIEAGRAQVLYLSLSDYVQHKHAPTAPEALAFMAAVDARVARLVALGAVVGITADHGMSDMANPNGTPRVTYLGDTLDAAFGEGATRVICPITDPFVRHHGALGGFVRVHLLKEGVSADAVRDLLLAQPGVALALTGDEAAARFEMPADREADFVVVGATGVALGARSADHDVTQLAGERLRSHGGLSEQRVPFLLSHPVENAHEGGRLRNFDIFDYALNRVG
ncbi:phosphonoacetate hydrolase [Ancylobacter oerskovii]|uniref:Phosphonoacetate hydrolase n=1 Tax=Ancylobacter oerskovii TaxID=459519 RepID=A0ABW4YYG5_9HYPH|nr:phosphonoacetate hydrolase [Ancylobacter oerskovii]MBS7541639.1 phosphonoacetate hydrolase [Ancylobacter oerskovii]